MRHLVLCLSLSMVACRAEPSGNSSATGAESIDATKHLDQPLRDGHGAPPQGPDAGHPPVERPAPPTGRPTIHYEIQVELDPDEHSLRASTSIHFPGARRGPIELYLNRGFSVESAEVDGASAGYSWGPPDRALPYVEAARALSVVPKGVASARSLAIAYDGRIPEPVADVNMLAPDLTELAIYAAWYPILATGEPFTYRLQVTAPPGYSLLSRGERVSATDPAGNRHTEVWEATIPDRDVLLMAMRAMQTKTSRVDGMEVEVHYRELPEAVAQQALDHATESITFFQGLYGPSHGKSQRLVFSPRDGWGYSRIGLIAQSERRHLARIAGDAGADDGPHGNAHEIAHLWWRVADPRTRHDWINEALAEYSATIDSWRRCGEACGLAWMQRFQESLHEARPVRGIVETGAEDEARHVSWYERGALLFWCLEQRTGREALVEILRALLARSEHRPVETSDVIELVSSVSPDFPIVEWLESARLDLVDGCLTAYGEGREPRP